jgi:class 3 adenylate cyclase
MHRVVPELIVENYRAGRFNGEFPAVGMFLDLTGFSSMTDTFIQQGQHGAEVLANLMHGVFNPLVENIFNYGGKIVSFAGDGIMAPVDRDGHGRSVPRTSKVPEVTAIFWIIKVADLDEALAWAKKATVACRGPVEVRPFQDDTEV